MHDLNTFLGKYDNNSLEGVLLDYAEKQGTYGQQYLRA